MSTGSEGRFAQKLHRTEAASEEVPSAQVEALQKLYEATNGIAWDWDLAKHESHWDWDLVERGFESTQLSKWKGVTIDENGNVVGLCLSDVRMDGQLPNELGNLEFLRELRLNNNRLWGSIPESLANLTELRYMDLSVNDLTGRIPDLARLSRLLTLDISYNRLQHEIGFLGHMTELLVLDLADNMLDGRVPQLGALTKLEYLDLSNNRLSGHIPEISTLKNLHKLDLSNNSLTGTISRNLGGLGKLRELNLSNNRLFGAVPRSLAQLLNLKKVALRGNRLDDESIPPELADPQLMNERVVLTTLFEATSGEDWYKKDDWRKEALISDWIGVTTNSTGFVESIELPGNNLSGTIPPEIGELTYLKRLNLRDNDLHGPIPPEIGHLWRLEVLDLGKNSLSGCIPEALFYLELLRKLYLNENTLDGPLSHEIKRLYNIEELDLGKNTLKCEIPLELSDLKTLKRLRLSDNELTGEIPPELFDTELNCLDLSNNHLSGLIPKPSVDSLHRKLEYLDLSENRLSGRIPSGLVSCSWSNERRPVGFDFGVDNIYDVNPVRDGYHRFVVERFVSLLADEIGYELFDRDHESGEIDEVETDKTEIGRLPVWKSRWRFEPQFINLSDNRLEGMVPEDLMVPSLMHLSLGRNDSLRVSMLSDITNLHHILYLDLNGVEIVDPPQDRTLRSLHYLNLSNHGLKKVPSWVSELSFLQFLILSDNELGVEEPLDELPLAREPHLAYLDLSNNKLSQLPPWISELRGLRGLDLSNNNLAGKFPTELFELRNLEHLDLHNNSLESSLHWLDFIRFSHLGDEVNLTTECDRLRYLDLTGNRLEAPVHTRHLWILGMLLEALKGVELENIDLEDVGGPVLARLAEVAGLAEVGVSDDELQELSRPITLIVTHLYRRRMGSGHEA